ncbi:MAG: tryptophan synthase subunit alpha [Planctomyces sp.]|nr:tryptophan synthase subunit alpha [Planctomyces sp.]MBA4039833.1 tryptophan synthase subunit alpha [Planctomyces sp.]MBA4120364.1 tryptophan synthase subunit alpha [Isosphaera sp.]
MSVPSVGGERVARAIRSAGSGPALVAYVTAGFPSKGALAGLLGACAARAEVLEVGVPFSDPMADGATIQRSSRAALAQGVTLEWILGELAGLTPGLSAPVVLMSYLNPLLNLPGGLGGLGARCAAAGVSAVIVPDLPLEEHAPVRASLSAAGVGLVQLVSPVSAPGRVARAVRVSDGFTYAVTMTGVTGGRAGLGGEVLGYLAGVREAARGVGGAPVVAGFGIRGADQVRALAGVVDGVIVASALVEELERGGDVGALLAGLRGAGV